MNYHKDRFLVCKYYHDTFHKTKSITSCDTVFLHNGSLFAHGCWHHYAHTDRSCVYWVSAAVWLHEFILCSLNPSSSSHMCRSGATALQCNLQSRGWSCGLSRGVRWGEAPHKRLSLILVVYVVQLLRLEFPLVHSQQHSVWRSQAELSVPSHSSHCNSPSGLQSYHYHSVKVPQTQQPGFGWH